MEIHFFECATQLMLIILFILQRMMVPVTQSWPRYIHLASQLPRHPTPSTGHTLLLQSHGVLQSEPLLSIGQTKIYTYHEINV